MLEVTDAVCERAYFRVIHIEAEHAKSAMMERVREWKPNVSETDHANARGVRMDGIKQLLCGSGECVCWSRRHTDPDSIECGSTDYPNNGRRLDLHREARTR